MHIEMLTMREQGKPPFFVGSKSAAYAVKAAKAAPDAV